MNDETDAPWQIMIDKMASAERRLPDEFWGMAATQALAQLAADLDGRLSDEEMSVLIGCGAMLIRLGREEAMAGIHAALAIRGIKPVRP